MKLQALLLTITFGFCAAAGHAFAQTIPTAPTLGAGAAAAAPQPSGRGGGRGQPLPPGAPAVTETAPAGTQGSQAGAGRGQQAAAVQAFVGAPLNAQQIQALQSMGGGFQAQQAGRGQPVQAGRGQAQTGRGGRGQPAPIPPADTLAVEFRSRVSAIMGEKGAERILLVTNTGWMRSTTTFKVGDEYSEGWRIASADPNLIVLKKDGQPDKNIDLTRWAGAIPVSGVTRAAAPAAPVVQLGSTGMVRSQVFGGRGPQTAAAGRGPAGQQPQPGAGGGVAVPAQNAAVAPAGLAALLQAAGPNAAARAQALAAAGFAPAPQPGN